MLRMLFSFLHDSAAEVLISMIKSNNFPPNLWEDKNNDSFAFVEICFVEIWVFFAEICGWRTEIDYFIRMHDIPQPKSAETVSITIVLYNTQVELLFKYLYIATVSQQVQAGWNLVNKTVHLHSSGPFHSVHFWKWTRQELWLIRYTLFDF